MDKFIVKHSKLLTRIFIIFASVFIALASYFSQASPLYIFLIYVITCLLFCLVINSIPYRKLNSIIKEYQITCKPKEYVEYAEFMYKYNPKSYITQINYASALAQKMEMQEKALEIMLSVALSKIPPKQTQVFFVYNLNLSAIYSALNNAAKAEEHYNIAFGFNDMITNPKIKEENISRLSGIASDIAIMKNDAEQAKAHLEKFNANCQLLKVTYAYNLARIYILENEIEKAKEQLEFVIQNASEIQEGQESIKLLEKLYWFILF